MNSSALNESTVNEKCILKTGCLLIYINYSYIVVEPDPASSAATHAPCHKTKIIPFGCLPSDHLQTEKYFLSQDAVFQAPSRSK